MIRQKAAQRLDRYQSRGLVKPWHDQSAFLLALCHVQLGNYTEAQQLFEESIKLMLSFGVRGLWALSAQPHWLVDICVLSGRIDLFGEVKAELDKFRLEKPRGLWTLYSLSAMELLLPAGEDLSTWIEVLLRRPKVKDTYAMGLSIQAIVDRNESALHDALLTLLEAHKGQATHGGLRETAEGLLCMPAMSLAYAALERHMRVQIENDYLSLAYLNYIRQDSSFKH